MSNALSTFRVLSTYPESDSKDVALSVEIKIMFNTDVDINTVNGGISVIAQNEEIPVKGILSYDNNRTISFKPATPLKPGTIYTVFVKTTIKNILGVECRAHSFIFKTKTETELGIPVLLEPAEGAMVKTVPELTWQSVKDAIGYDVEISVSKDFATKVWNGTVNCAPEVDNNRVVFITPDRQLREDTIYFWRVRPFTVVTDNNGTRYPKGVWTEPNRFVINSDNVSVIAPEDEPYIDPAFEEDGEPVIELIDSFPENKFSNVGVNLKTIAIRFKGIIDPLKIDPRKWIVEGQHVTEDQNLEDYGVTDSMNTSHHRLVDGRWFVSVDEEKNETIIMFQPVKL